MKKLILIMFLLSSSLLANSINLALAANVSYAIEKLILEFNKKHPNIKVQVTLGSSGKLTAQIKNGAPYDLFMSANMKYPINLYENKLSLTKPLIYARGSLAIFSHKDRNFVEEISIVAKKSIEKIAIANPKTAP